MGVIRAEDVIGYLIGEQCVCCNCATRDEEESVSSQNEIITIHDVEDSDDLYFCDRCRGQLAC